MLVTMTETGIRYPDDEHVPDEYSDGLQVQIDFASVGLVFTKLVGEPATPRPVAVVRLSPQQLKIVQLLLAESVRQYEEMSGAINVPENVLRASGLLDIAP
jgi:hypothetical protein